MNPDTRLNMAEFRRKLEASPKRCCIEITFDAEQSLPEEFFIILGKLEDSKSVLVTRHYPRPPHEEGVDHGKS